MCIFFYMGAVSDETVTCKATNREIWEEDNYMCEDICKSKPVLDFRLFLFNSLIYFFVFFLSIEAIFTQKLN